MLAEIAAEVNNPSFKGKSKKGVKCSPLFDFISLHHFLSPPLHSIIGIWNNICDRFREIVREVIEYIPREEADL